MPLPALSDERRGHGQAPPLQTSPRPHSTANNCGSRRLGLRPSVSSPLVLAARLHRREARQPEVGEFAYELEAEGGLEVHDEDVEVCVLELAQLPAERFGREVA